MPLYREEEALGAHLGLDRLDCAVGGSCRYDKSGCDVLYRLMVEGIRKYLIRARKLAQKRTVGHFRRTLVYSAALVLTVAVDVLIECAAEGYVEKL